VVVPWSRTEVVDVHHMRSDLLKDPSAILEGMGGGGVELNVMLSYRLGRFFDKGSSGSSLQGLYVEAGYRYWHLESGMGSSTFRKPTGDEKGRFNGATSERRGAIVGLELRF